MSKQYYKLLYICLWPVSKENQMLWVDGEKKTLTAIRLPSYSIVIVLPAFSLLDWFKRKLCSVEKIRKEPSTHIIYTLLSWTKMLCYG